MLYGVTIVLGLFVGSFAVELTSSIASDAVISMFQNYAWQPPADEDVKQTPSEMIAALDIAE
ncbi:MAG: hypothetical protein EBY21_00670 [Alphaproteobacteria bacterium]|nr:hypothetical protein [Alphaproteobacteria bacterium]